MLLKATVSLRCLEWISVWTINELVGALKFCMAKKFKSSVWPAITKRPYIRDWNHKLIHAQTAARRLPKSCHGRCICGVGSSQNKSLLQNKTSLVCSKKSTDAKLPSQQRSHLSHHHTQSQREKQHHVDNYWSQCCCTTNNGSRDYNLSCVWANMCNKYFYRF